MRVTALARSWSLCIILSDHRIIVPHLNDNWFFFHKLYHPKLLWFIHMVQWYCEILILVHFASDGTCQILKPMCHCEWPRYCCSTFKWQVIRSSFINCTIQNSYGLIHMAQWYGEILILVHKCEWQHSPDLGAYVSF